MALLLSTAYDSLPAEPALRWLRLRDHLEVELERREHDPDVNILADYEEYYTVLATTAKALGIANIPINEGCSIEEEYYRLRPRFVALAAKLNAKTTPQDLQNSVALERSARRTLNAEIDRLRMLISASDLAPATKNDAYRALDELKKIVEAPRTDLGKFFKILGLIAIGVATSTSFLADAPDAIATITKIIGEAKVDEDNELIALEKQAELLLIEDMSAEDTTQ